MKDMNQQKYTICPCCKETVPCGKYCPECGALLSKASGAVAVGEQTMGYDASPVFNIFIPGEMSIETSASKPEKMIEEHRPVNDAGLTLLGDFCKRTMATVGGLCGGMYICKYRKDGVIHRVTTDNCGTDGPAILMQVGNLLGSYIREELLSQMP